MDKKNRRIEYTKKCLKEGLVSLLKKKPLEVITITELCEEADVNRSTFYKHYSNLNNLLISTQNEIILDVEQLISAMSVKDIKRKEIIENVLYYILNNSTTCYILLCKNNYSTFQSKIFDMGEGLLRTEIESSYNIDDRRKDIVVNFLLNGTTSVIYDWIDGGFINQPKELAEIIDNLTSKVLSLAYLEQKKEQ